MSPLMPTKEKRYVSAPRLEQMEDEVFSPPPTKQGGFPYKTLPQNGVYSPELEPLGYEDLDEEVCQCVHV